LAWLRANAYALLAVLAALALLVAIVANHLFGRADLRTRAEALTGGNADRGLTLFVAKGCGGCHTLEGVPQANGLVGPPLDGVGVREIVGGKLANTPENIELWISAPQSIVPGNAMPDIPMTAQDAKDIAAFLYATG
jgi:cytochrome c1